MSWPSTPPSHLARRPSRGSRHRSPSPTRYTGTAGGFRQRARSESGRMGSAHDRSPSRNEDRRSPPACARCGRDRFRPASRTGSPVPTSRLSSESEARPRCDPPLQSPESSARMTTRPALISTRRVGEVLYRFCRHPEMLRAAGFLGRRRAEDDHGVQATERKTSSTSRS